MALLAQNRIVFLAHPRIVNKELYPARIPVHPHSDSLVLQKVLQVDSFVELRHGVARGVMPPHDAYSY